MTEGHKLDVDRSLDLYRRAHALIPGGSQTNSKRAEAYALGAYPIYVERGEGARVWDVDGNEYIDYVCALGPVVLGYCVPEIDEAVHAQLAKGVIYGLLSPLEVEVAELICELVPCAESIRLFKGGGEATSAAARIVRAYTGRNLILNCGYRGWPDTWVSDREPGVSDGVKAGTRRFPWGKLDALEALFDDLEGQVAAVFLDCQRPPPEGYLQSVRDLAHRHGALLVFDEIVTGFRLAAGGAQDYFGVVPDLACFAKAIANGLPLAVVAGKTEIMAIAKDLVISITYGGEALSLAAAAATLKFHRDRDVAEKLWTLGARLCDGLNRAADEIGIGFRAGGYAPMTGITFRPVDGISNDTIWTYFLQECAARGVLLRRRGKALVTYSHTEEQIDRTVSSVGEVLSGLSEAIRRGDVESVLRVLPPEAVLSAGSEGK